MQFIVHERESLPAWAWEAWTELASGGDFVALEALDPLALELTLRIGENHGQPFEPLFIADTPEELLVRCEGFLAALGAL